MNSIVGANMNLNFPLNVEDGWPPVAAECLPFKVTPDGYVALSPPLFVKDLSVGDVINATLDAEDYRVTSWRHVTKSGHTTVWLLRIRRTNTIEAVLLELRDLGCNTVELKEAGVYSVDVPELVSIETVDIILAHIDADLVAVAFPSMRHPEPKEIK